MKSVFPLTCWRFNLSKVTFDFAEQWVTGAWHINGRKFLKAPWILLRVVVWPRPGIDLFNHDAHAHLGERGDGLRMFTMVYAFPWNIYGTFASTGGMRDGSWWIHGICKQVLHWVRSFTTTILFGNYLNWPSGDSVCLHEATKVTIVAIGSYWLFQSLGFWMFLRLHTMKVRWNLEGYVDAVFKVASAKRCEDTLKTLS